MIKQLFLIRLFVLFLTIACFIPLFAQISEGGLPPSFKINFPLKDSKAPYEVKINFNVDDLKKEDAKNEALGFPLRVTKIIPVDINMENSGEWSTLSNGQRIWKLTIVAQGAIATMLYYDEFYIPKGGKLFIYNPGHTQVLGAYTSGANPKAVEFATELVAGDQLILEYAEPTTKKSDNMEISGISEVSGESINPDVSVNQLVDQPRIQISGVAYGYNNLKVYKNSGLRADGNFNLSGSCMVNINCPEGDDWQHQKRSVARTLTNIDGSGYLCTGSMMNNTAGNLDALYITAHHCFYNEMNAGTASFNTMMFYFNWEQPDCERTNIEPTNVKTWVGAQLLVDINISGGSDGVLLRLNNGGSIPDDYNLFYNGWDRRSIPATNGVGIHHPHGDVKKISTFSAPASSASWYSLLEDNSPVYGAANAHWNVKFIQTPNGYCVTEGGSSGSPLFNQDGRVVGTLSGGNSSCDTPSGNNLYGKLWYHWDQGSTDPVNQMKTYLDPVNRGDEYIDGKYAAGEIVANFATSKSDLYASESVAYTDVSLKASTWKWIFNGGSPANYEGKNPPAVLYNVPGTYTTTLVINEGTVNEKTKSGTITVRQKINICADTMKIGIGTSKSQFPLGIQQRHVLSSAIYTAEELGNAAGTITELAWNAASSTALGRTVYVYMKETDDAIFASTGTWAAEMIGLTPVSQSVSTWVNDAGWTTIKLTTPFQYSGTKNLKIIVRSSAAAAGTISSDCYYTATNVNMMQQWSSTSVSLTSNIIGVLSMNRPNIRFAIERTCGTPVAPVANFTAGGIKVLLKEGFDQRPFPTPGWAIEKPGTSSNQWRQSTFSGYEFSKVDPSSVSSAIISPDASNIVDAWIKTPSVSITDATALIKFYVLYAGSALSNAQVNFFVSEDGGSTWGSPLWTTGNANNTLGSAWRKQIIDLSAYSGKTVKFAWQYVGRNGTAAALDNVRVFSSVPDGKAEICEGQTVNFTDLSSGPPVLWNWTLPGGIPSSSTLQNPVITYMNQGVYDATIRVTNNFGNDLKTIPGAVAVKAQVPVSVFASGSAGLIMQNNNGQFLPFLGGAVSFQDKTANYPKAWSWALNGALPSSSTSQNVKVTYPAGENSYSVALQTSNSSGSNTLTTPDYIKVGGKADVWNVLYGESPYVRYANNGYALTGADFFPQMAERFNSPAPGEISQVKVYTQNVTRSSGRNMIVSIYSDNGGLPGVALSPVMTIPAAAIVEGGYNIVTFPVPVGISGAFHVVVGSTDYNYTYFTVPSVESRSSKNNTVSAYYQDAWMAFNAIFNTLNISMNIVPEFKYTKLDFTTAKIFKKKNIDPEAETVSFTTNATGDWRATTSDSWIVLSAVSGNGNGSFTFTCENNEGYLRSGLITVEAGGAKQYVVIQQAGINPVNLTANYQSSDGSANLTWKHSVDFNGIFDDAEAHPDFAVNSAGSVGWNYIDGDAAGTDYMSTIDCLNKGAAMAFMVMNPSQTTPAWTNTAITPHSGSKFFASFCSLTPPNNDWMISPELNFTTQFKFSFWAKSFIDTYGLERFRVLYSTTGKNAADFTQAVTSGSYVEAPASAWTRYEYLIPAEAKYVAINCVSNGAFVFMVDDISIGTGIPLMSTRSVDPKAFSDSDMQTMKNTKFSQKVQPEKLPLIIPATEKANKWGLKATVVNSQLKSSQTQNLLRSTAETKLRWDNGMNQTGIGLPEGGKIEVAVRFETPDLYKYQGCEIKAVEIYPISTTSNIVLNIHQGNVIIYSQPLLGVTAGQFNRIELSHPVRIDATKDLWIGYLYTQAPGTYVAGCDGGPANVGKGDLIKLGDNEFESLYTTTNGVLNYNWNITAILEDNSGHNSDITFNVYRNNTLIKTGLATKTFKDLTQTGGNLCYTVDAVHNADNSLETTHSNEACVFAPSVIEVQAFNNSRYQYQDNPTFNFNVTGNLMGLHTIDEMRSWVTLSCEVGFDSPAGYYPINVAVRNNDPANFVFRPINGILTVLQRTRTEIVENPQSAGVCIGSNYLLKVKAVGEHLSYQWYEGNSPILGATDSMLLITNIAVRDTVAYHVDVRGDAGTVSSAEAKLSVIDPLPSQLIFTDCPNLVEIGRPYRICMTNYLNVTNYFWSYSGGEASFDPASGTSNETMVVFNGSTFGAGKISVELQHVCGVRTATQNISVSYSTGIDKIDDGHLKIYPNPVNNLLNISCDQLIKSITVSSIEGKLMESYNGIESYSFIIHASKWERGTYLIIIKTNDGQISQKVIKK